jgi:hypothetical protein
MKFALARFAPAAFAAQAQRFAGWEAVGEPEAFSSPRNILFGCLCERLQAGELAAYGIKRGTTTPERIEPQFFRDAVRLGSYDLNSDRIESDGTVYSAVEIIDAAAIEAVKHPAPARRGGVAVEGKFLAWATLLDHRPTKREADAWATDPANGASTTLVRQWRAKHFPGAPGRPRKA